MPDLRRAQPDYALNPFRLSRLLAVTLMLAVGACGGGSGDAALPPGGGDPTSPEPPSTPEPPPTSPEPPAAPPPAPPPPPSSPPVHAGIPFGPNVYTKHESSTSIIPPSGIDPAFTGLVTAAYPPTLIAKLEAARRVNGRVLLSFAGNSDFYRDSNGFNLSMWKAKTDRFRGIDISSYIADGTLMGNFLMDEPSDPKNWFGHQVSRADIDEMARYSKEIWPDLPAIIRGWPWYLKGYQYQYLDAAWAQYHARFGSIDDFIATNSRDAKDLGLSLVIGLNALSGGGEHGMQGFYKDKFSMTASQLKTWGGALLAQPYGCAFFMFRYDTVYFARPDIREAMAELSQKAQSLPVQPCRRL